MFHSARIKLTAWYLLIIMLISMSFSVVVYNMLTHEVERFARIQSLRIERRLHEDDALPIEERLRSSSPVVDSELVEETKQRIGFILIAINAGIFILSGGVGYFLAGRTLKPIKEMVEEQNRFIGDASHELRTPLTALKSSMEVYLRGKNLTLKQAKELISENISEVDNLQILSDKLLLFVQYQKANIPSEFEKLSLAQVVTEAVSRIKKLAKEKDINIKNDLKENEIEGDKFGLIDLFVILLDNAIKYSSKKSVVSISSKKTDDFIEISIEDNGIGISEKDIPYIFDRFYRADVARSKNDTSGYGLGLSIAKQIVDIHRGLISVESKSEKGTKFVVRLLVCQQVHSKRFAFFS